ncbi:ABC transporter substrate-binding protein [Streptomyces sp. NPDC048417]|uniref:ABC transporter substrate-binding protein n=1 Tax=Streptomyces sp. NPDC048417 TaxID=3155387 RepID=UPI00341DCA9B
MRSAGRRLAVHAPHTAPGCFTRIVLRKAGLDPDRDIKTLVRPPGDYGMDLRRLRDGEIDAALVGSTMAPEAVAAEHGWNVLAWIGDHFQIPTVGLAVDPTYTDPDGPAVQAVLRAHRRALQVIHNDPDTTVRHMRTFLGGQTADEARAHYSTYIAPHFTLDGQADPAVGDRAITAVAAELGVPAGVTAAEFYRTATTTS